MLCIIDEDMYPEKNLGGSCRRGSQLGFLEVEEMRQYVTRYQFLGRGEGEKEEREKKGRDCGALL